MDFPRLINYSSSKLTPWEVIFLALNLIPFLKKNGIRFNAKKPLAGRYLFASN
jgi:hypothetical protein